MAEKRTREDDTTSLAAADGRANDGKAPARYDRPLATRGKPSKAEVQDQLQRTSDAISTRAYAILEELSLSGETVRAFVGNPLVGLLGALGTGIIVGRVFGGSRHKGSHAPDPEALADLLLREVELALDRGESVEEAIDRVVDSMQIGDHRPPRSSESVFKWIADLALRTLLSHGIDTMVGREAESNGKGSREAPPAEGSG